MLEVDSLPLNAHLQKYFGFDSFKGDQEKIITSILEGKDTFVIMPTGGGKSMCYQLPSLIMDGTAIIVSPLIALMKEQCDEMEKKGIPVCVFNGDTEKKDIETYTEKIKEDKKDIQTLDKEILYGKENSNYRRRSSWYKRSY